MTFLELANRLLLESDISGTGLVTTVNQKGEYKQMVDYIQTAYQDIQNIHANWDFLRKDLGFNTIANVRNYSDTSISLPDLGEWDVGSMRIYLASGGIANEQYLTPVEYDDFRAAFLFGNARSQTGVPTHITVKPDKSLQLYPIPNNIYAVNGEYYCEPFSLLLDTDKPAFPQRFHMIIVWRALMFFAAKINAQELFAIGSMEFRRLLFKLEQFDVPAKDISDSLA